MKHGFNRVLRTSLALGGVAMFCAGPSHAEEDIGAHLAIELNAAAEEDAGCKLSFLALNGHRADLSAVMFETVLFDAGGQVDRLTLLDFADLPAARPRVRQFVIPGMACSQIGKVLFNGVTSCEADDLGPKACTEGLELNSKVTIEVTG